MLSPKRPLVPALIAGIPLLFLGSPARCGEDEAEAIAEANRHLGAGRSKEAIEILEPLAASNPKSAELQYALAQARILQKDFPKARAHLQKTVDLDPDRSEARLLLASILLHKDKKLKDAARQVEGVLKRSPKDPKALKVMGEIEMAAKRFEKAAGWYGKALTERPDDLVLASLVASALTESVKALAEGPKAKRDGQGDQAIAALRRILELKPDYHDVHFNMGTVAILCERWDEGIRHLETYLEKKPGDGRALYNLAKAQESAGRPKDAIETWKKFIDVAGKGDDRTLKGDIPRAKARIRALEKEAKSPRKTKRPKRLDGEEPSRKEEPVPKLGL